MKFVIKVYELICTCMRARICTCTAMSNHVIYFSSSSSKLIPPWLLARVPMAEVLINAVGRYKLNLSLVTTQTSEKMDQDLYRKFIESNREQ